MPAQTAHLDSRELTLSRTFDAPRRLVWEAWTDPKHIGKWWGPHGFKTGVERLDLRLGGVCHLMLQAPDGSVWPCKGTYREIKAPERIVYVGEAEVGHPCGAGLPPRATVTVTFDEHAGRTTVTVHTVFEAPAMREAAIAHGFREGWEASFDHLAQHLAGHS